jgi:predicted RNase H-like HicB family nuclease
MICSKQSNGSYFAICPEIRSCFTQGDTYEETVEYLKELVEITIKEELSKEEVNEILLSKSKIFSEFEVVV